MCETGEIYIQFRGIIRKNLFLGEKSISIETILMLSAIYKVSIYWRNHSKIYKSTSLLY